MGFLFLTNDVCFAQGKFSYSDNPRYCRSAVFLSLANDQRIVYPSELQQKGVQGEVVVTCDIMKNGWTDHCQVVSSSGEKAFELSVLNYARAHVYRPAVCNHKPVVEYGRSYKVKFSIPGG